MRLVWPIIQIEVKKACPCVQRSNISLRGKKPYENSPLATLTNQDIKYMWNFILFPKNIPTVDLETVFLPAVIYWAIFFMGLTPWRPILRMPRIGQIKVFCNIGLFCTINFIMAEVVII